MIDGEPHGSIEVYYLEERPELDEGPFTSEERILIEGMARSLSETIEHRLAEKSLSVSESGFRNLFENAGISIWNGDMSALHDALSQLRLDGVTDLRQHLKDDPQAAADLHKLIRVTDVNKATLELFGAKTEDEFLGSISRIFSSNAVDVFVEGLCVFWEGKRSFRGEASYRSFDNRDITAIVSFNFPDTREGSKSVPVSLIDVTESKKAEQELRKLSRAVDSSSAAVVITDLEGNIEYVNPVFSEMTGYAREEVIGANPRLLKSGETKDMVYADMWRNLFTVGEWKGEFRNKKKDGTLYWSRANIFAIEDEKGDTSHFVSIQDDVTHEYELTEQLSYQASHDLLTGLINRREFERRAERLLATVEPDKGEHALCYMDLDQFKVVNDTCGHAAGDELLRQLSIALQAIVRHRDTLARLGGDEFGVLMEHCSLDDAQRVTSSLRKVVQDFHFSWGEHSFRVGVSIGLVAIDESTSNLTELLKAADAACYMAKESGRDRVQIYRPEDAEIAERRGEMQWVERIHRALKEDRFCLDAQTILPLDRTKVKNYELLVRLVDEQGERIVPGAFLPAAERYNLMTQIDCWVVEKAFVSLAPYPDFLNQIDFISINLSGHSLGDDKFRDFVIDQLGAKDVMPGKICFEITETAAIANLRSAKAFIAKMKELGCRFALDDFGSGLSSFAYLKDLPVDYVKIDGVFVRGIVDDRISHAMVKSINEIGQVMGMQTIAEFVESEALMGMLREIGVNYCQGYGIDRPFPLDELLSRSNNESDV